MKQRLLTSDEVLIGYDAIADLYPYIAPLSAWRGWEYAAFQRYSLPEPVLDVGCGDGRLFQLVYPHIRQVVGIDHDPKTVEVARQSGIYQAVHETAAHRLPFPPETFASAFANSSIEHMDHLPEVLASVHHSLWSGGTFLLSVVTEKFLDWLLLPSFVGLAVDPSREQELRDAYVRYHKLVNPLPVREWVQALEVAGFEVVEHVPVVPEVFGRMFLLIDQLWHVRRGDGELGDVLSGFLTGFPRFPGAFRHVLYGLMEMERDWTSCAGAVFLARRPL